jgi:tetratricopeptide (TPR) repeat protein
VPFDADELLRLAMARPRYALGRARAVLAGRPEAFVASVARQAIGIVLRDNGDVDEGIRELRRAVLLARRSGSAEREADVLASLGAALAFAGRPAPGLRAFDKATKLATGPPLGRVLHRRGVANWALGQYTQALDDFRRAVRVLERADDTLWTARALNGRGMAFLYVGQAGRSDADFVASGRLYMQLGQTREVADTVLNRGEAAFRRGDLPAALSLLDEAAALYGLDVPPELSHQRCEVLRAAGRVTVAQAEADTAVAAIERMNGQATSRAELLLTAAQCALAAGRPQEASQRAGQAYRLFRSQANAWSQAHARLVLVQARHAAGPATGRLLRSAEQTVADLDAHNQQAAPQGHLLAGRIATDLGRRGEAGRHLAEVARQRWRGPAVTRASGWLGAALQASAAGQHRRMLAACRRGLDVLDEYQGTFGASELRAQATTHGAELATLAIRHVAHARDPRLLLAWAERWRATALTVPPVRPSADAELNARLAALRDTTRRLEEARLQGSPTAGALRREQQRLELAVQERSLHARGAAAPRTTISVPELLDQLGDVRLAEIVDVNGTLHVLVCAAGRVRHFVAGPTADAVRASEFARFALRRLARLRPATDPAGALAILAAAGPRLQDALLGQAARYLGDGQVVIVPPGKLHAIPWCLLPEVGERVFSVAPSANAWLRARAAPVPARHSVTLAAGPGLAGAATEVSELARLYDDVTVLTGADATASRVLAALDGAWLGHVAAHGSFRADSPLFSSLRMHDGPLTVYDFEDLRRAPHLLVLSSCESGMLAPAGADELLGLVASLLPMGTAGVVAGLVPLNDDALVRLMVALHRGLRAGQSLAESLWRARRTADMDPVEHAAAMSLVALGAG